MNAKRIAKRIMASEKPVHWVTAAARRVLAGEDFDAVMQDLAARHALHSPSAFRSVERELRNRVEQERRVAAKHYTPIQAANELVAALDKNYGKGAGVWDKTEVERYGWGGGAADAAVHWEGGPDMSLMQLYEKEEPFVGNGQPWEGVFVEPYSTWLMYFYAE